MGALRDVDIMGRTLASISLNLGVFMRKSSSKKVAGYHKIAIYLEKMVIISKAWC